MEVCQDEHIIKKPRPRDGQKKRSIRAGKEKKDSQNEKSIMGFRLAIFIMLRNHRFTPLGLLPFRERSTDLDRT